MKEKFKLLKVCKVPGSIFCTYLLLYGSYSLMPYSSHLITFHAHDKWFVKHRIV